ncbi:hypothetical protein JCM10207_002596 [Rhodosporidiobolus poonsookiae]
MTTLPILPPSTSWSSNPHLSQPRISGIPSHFLSRPLSGLSAHSLHTGLNRPLSTCSTLSALSATSSTSASSATGERRRRSIALLDLEASLPLDDPSAAPSAMGGIRDSLLRAEAVLRASERERELERRRGRASFRARQVHSAHLLEHVWAAEGEADDEATEDLSAAAAERGEAQRPGTGRRLSEPLLSTGTGAEIEPPPALVHGATPSLSPPPPTKPERKATLKRFSPKRLLRKAQSIPVDMLFSPSAGPKRYSNDSSASDTADPYGYDDPQYRPLPPAPPPPPAETRLPPRPTLAPRRAASAADLLSTAQNTVRYPAVVASQIPRPATSSSFYHDLTSTLPTRLSYLALPDNEPPSKFSASSGEGTGGGFQLVDFGFGDGFGGGTSRKARGRGLKERARTFSHASGAALGLKSLRGKRTPSRREKGEKVRKKPSLADLFSGFGGGASDGSSAEKAKKAPRGVSYTSTSSAASRIPTSSSGHRPSTSISSHTTTTSTTPSLAATATSDSHAPAPKRKPSRLGFLRSAVRDSSFSGGSGASSLSRASGGSVSLRARSRTKSANPLSPSIISRPLSVSASTDGSCSAHGHEYGHPAFPSSVAMDDRRSSSATASTSASGSAPARSEKEGEKTTRAGGGWASRISRAVKGNVAAKRALFEGKMAGSSPEGERTVLFGEKRAGKSPSPQLASRLPSRLPLATVFPTSATQPPPRPPRPSTDLHSLSSVDDTFNGYQNPPSGPAAAVKSRAAAFDALGIKSSAPRVRAKTGIPVAKSRLSSNAAAGAALQSAQPSARPAEPRSLADELQLANSPSSRLQTTVASPSSLFPPAQDLPSGSFPIRRPRDAFDASSLSSPESPTSSSSGGFTSSSDDSPRPTSMFRSPSPARFRDLLPSETAQSSPERNERGLPMPKGETVEGSPRSVRSGERDSPKKRAMGPEQVIVMEDERAPNGPINEVRGATTDLADLLTSLEDTFDLNASGGASSLSTRPHIQADTSDLSASLRCHLPHLDSIESFRSTVSDVPLDLKRLIDVVDDHISEVDILPSFVIEGTSLGARGFADELEVLNGADEALTSDSDGSSSEEEDGPPGTTLGGGIGGFLSVSHGETAAFSRDGGTTTLGFTASYGYDATASSFEGHLSTAGAVLRSMLRGPDAEEGEHALRGVPEADERDESSSSEEEEDPRAVLRESVRDALELGRPSHGDKMFDEVDIHVQLSALLDGPSPPPSPEDVRQQAFLRNHFRSASAFSSTEGSLESHFSLNGSPTPYLRSGRPLRQSLARYSQDRFPTKQPSHRARPVSEQSSLSSEHDHLGSNDPTSLSLAQSSRSTNLSISSLTSSPCPVPRARRIPMLTRGPSLPMLKPSFRFPPEKPSSATIKITALGSPFEPKEDPMEQYGARRVHEEDSSDDESGPIRSATLRASTSPRFVRPLRPPRAGEPIPRPRLLELQQLPDHLIPPDTPPPSSPSISDGERSHRPSFDFETGPPPAALSRKRSKGRHSRQQSRSSSVIQSTIVEHEDEYDDDYDGEDRAIEEEEPADISLAVRLHLQPLSPVREAVSPIRIRLSPQRVPVSVSPPSNPPSVEIVLAEPESVEHHAQIVELDGNSETDEDPEFEFEFTAETNLELTRAWCSMHFEAEMEIKRSVVIWPDTDASREAVARFNAPRTYHAILEFLFYSQNRFPSPPHLVRLPSFVPPAFDDLPTPPSPVRIPSPIVDSSFETDTRGLFLSTTETPPSPEPPSPPPPQQRGFRKPLAPKALNKQVEALSRSTSSDHGPVKPAKEGLSPFTALPPRLGSKLRKLSATSATSASSYAKASVSPPRPLLGLGGQARASIRRQEQLEAAMRRLEGTGRPGEQRSDSESDFTGVLEASGEATDEFTFTKITTPRLSTQRPRVRRKTALTSLR